MNYIFTAGTARGGTNFRTLVLGGHSKVAMAIDPFIPLFRLYRDQLLMHRNLSQIKRRPAAVLDDYYFAVEKRDDLKALQQSDPNIPFPMAEWPRLKQELASRMSLASSNLIPALDQLPGQTFRDVFSNAANIVHTASGGSQDILWTGFNDNWTAEFFPLLAQLFPEAKFVLHLRDPRSVLHASEFGEPNPKKRPTVMSFARHLRKYYAFGIEFNRNPWLDGRVLVSKYETAIQDPEEEARRLTEFLDLDFESDMLQVENFRKADGSKWDTSWDIYRTSLEPWRNPEVPLPLVELTEFVCQHEMQLFGYELAVHDSTNGLSDAALAFAIRNTTECLGWSTDFAELERTIGSELYRNRILESALEVPVEQVERLFLFQSVYDAIKGCHE